MGLSKGFGKGAAAGRRGRRRRAAAPRGLGYREWQRLVANGFYRGLADVVFTALTGTESLATSG